MLVSVLLAILKARPRHDSCQTKIELMQCSTAGAAWQPAAKNVAMCRYSDCQHGESTKWCMTESSAACAGQRANVHPCRYGSQLVNRAWSMSHSTRHSSMLSMPLCRAHSTLLSNARQCNHVPCVRWLLCILSQRIDGIHNSTRFIPPAQSSVRPTVSETQW
jgi:hypothetical protein